MKKFWVEVDPWDTRVAATALESGADALIVPGGCAEKARKLGRISIVSADGDLKPGDDVVRVLIDSKEKEQEALRLSRQKTVIVSTKDWAVIPLENIIAESETIMAEVRNSDEAKLVSQVLEKGVAGVVLRTRDLNEIKKTSKLLKETAGNIGLAEAVITLAKPVGMGDRVCIDTCTNMKPGEGMLVGNSSSAMFLVHSETVENPYVEPRPFRVNAGGVHAYVLLPGGKTKYLSELRSGDEVLIVDFKGRSQAAAVGRVKMERRPMMLVEAKCGEAAVSLIMQNAETIRLTAPEGSPVSVVELKPGDRVLAYRGEAGRHFGIKICETITEK